MSVDQWRCVYYAPPYQANIKGMYYAIVFTYSQHFNYSTLLLFRMLPNFSCGRCTETHRFFCEPAGPSNATVEQQRATTAAAPAQTVRCSVSLQRLTDTGKLKTLLYWLITIACLYMFPAVPSVHHT